jgi:hypothetical protein
MHEDKPHPSDLPARTELTGMLRDAVEQVHAQPVPFESVSRSLDRAKQLEAMTMKRTLNLGWRPLAMAAMLAAALFGPFFLVGSGTGDTLDENGLPEEWAMAVEQSREDQTGLGVELPNGNGLRAMTLRVDIDTVVSGFLQPNSSVDLISIVQGKVNKSGYSQTILQDAPVLAVEPLNQRDPEKGDIVSQKVTVAVTPEQAELLTLAQQVGSLGVSLRQPDDQEKSTIRTLKAEDIRLGRVNQFGVWNGASTESLEFADASLRKPVINKVPDVTTGKPWKLTLLNGDSSTKVRFLDEGPESGGLKLPEMNRTVTRPQLPVKVAGTSRTYTVTSGRQAQQQNGRYGPHPTAGSPGANVRSSTPDVTDGGRIPGAFIGNHEEIALNGVSQSLDKALKDAKQRIGDTGAGWHFNYANGAKPADQWGLNAGKDALRLEAPGANRAYRLETEQALLERLKQETTSNLRARKLTDRGVNKERESVQRVFPVADLVVPITGGKPGTVDAGKLSDLAKKWGELSAAERAKLLPTVLKAQVDAKMFSPDVREVLTLSSAGQKKELLQELDREIDKKKEILSRSAASADQAEEITKLKKLREELDKIEPKQPQVWKQNRGRPTFARVHLGDGNSLELVSLHVTTTIDGPRARTVVDHVFKNPHERQLEGTFEYPLPTGASPSYYAMFPGKTRTEAPPLFAKREPAKALSGELLASRKPDLMARAVSTDDWGNLMESRVVNQQKALEVYEDVTRARIDPALLEYAGGNTFSGRVFPIPPKGFSRVIMAYEELLPVIGDKDVYRFTLPDCKLNDIAFTLQATAAECKEAGVNIAGQTKDETDSKLTHRAEKLAYERHWTNDGPGGEVRFTFTPPEPRIHVASGRQNDGGPLYVYARVRPDLKVQRAASSPESAVFLLDTSLSEHPDRFAVNMMLLQRILESDPEIRRFNILTFNVGAAWVDPNGWIRNTKAGRERAFNTMDGIILEGATDFSSALDKLSTTPFIVSRPEQPVNVFVLSDGQITWGESDVNALVSRFESRCPKCRFHCYRTGLGADNLELFTALTRRGGGVFSCYSEADLAAAAVAHRNQCFTVESAHFVGGPAVSDVLIAGRQAAVYPGGEMLVAGRAAETGKTTLVVEGTYLGKRMVQEYPVEIAETGELAPRGWGEIAVASLLSLNDPKHDNLVTAYCQQFGIGSRTASFLILENESEYKRFNLDEERGKMLTGDLGKWLDETWKGFGKVLSARESFKQFLDRIEGRVKLMSGAQAEHVKNLLALMSDADYELPPASVNGKILRETDVPVEYLVMRESDPQNVHTYLAEAQRRVAKQDVDSAVRVLSSVIEEHPGRSDALRLVGYRLLDMQQPAHASRLFERVERSRPFEPHSYRDLARSLEACGKYGLAAVHYEIILAGTWHARFRDSLKEVALEEYSAMMRDALRRRAVVGKLADQFGERLEKLDASKAQSDLRVTISWNTDNTDVDLWVIEPDGEKCFYSHNKTKSGGELSQDMTQGYGPERYQTKKAQKGTYRVIVNYFNMNPNLLAGETHVNVTVTRFAGTPQETTERHTVILRQAKEEVEVCKVEF